MTYDWRKADPLSHLSMAAMGAKPALEINADTVARFKPALSKFYYDPSRYSTYLEQLGIKFPMLEPSAKRAAP